MSGPDSSASSEFKRISSSNTMSPATSREEIHGVTANINGGVGLSDPNMSSNRRRMLDLVNKLHSTGVQVDIDLPQIAVIGSQSAGKSSLIESISGITLPRAAGTCTRCPTECRLSRSTSRWQCVVSLRYINDSRGQPLGQAHNQTFGGVIYDKNHVEDRIRRAQTAILNPSKPFKQFLEGDDSDAHESELSFSANCVSLQISGPDVADLSFCDLPGLIASVSSKSKGGGNDIALVEKLVTSYIKKPSCIILLTVACETDFENQGAHRLAKEHDPLGKRTIGVLTKPDRIPTGEEANWLPFIRNEKESLENNWFCVKQPSSNDLKSQMTWSQARQREDEFFSMTSPWCELDAVYQKYLRTSNLVERLSLVLSDLISKRLPQIQEELENTISATRNALLSLPPPPPANPQSEITALIHSFVLDLNRHADGVPDEDGLLQSIRPAQERFRREIRVTAPNFRPFERKYEDTRHISQAKFLVQEEGDKWDHEDSDPDEDEEPEVVDEEYTPEESPQPVGRSNNAACSNDTPNPYTRGTKRKDRPSNKIYIDEVLERAHRARTRELPGHYPFVVQKTFIEAIIKEWKSPAMALCETVYGMISEHVKHLISEHFQKFGQGYLAQRIRAVMNQHLKRCLSKAREKILWLLDVEDQPFSLNTHYLSDYHDKFLAHYKGERQRYNHPDMMSAIDQTKRGTDLEQTLQQVGMSKVLTGLAEMGLTGITANVLKKLLPPDTMEPALGIMADVRAYFQVAYKRFADNVPLAIDYELVRGIARDVLRTLYTELKVNGAEGDQACQDLAQESPQVADRRADLMKKLERLDAASRDLMSMGM